MRIGVLTSSRADYGIYKPLLHALNADSVFNTELIAFGTHLSPYHGYTLQQIKEDGFDVKYTVQSLLTGDDANAISTAYSLTALKFADFWERQRAMFDVVFCLGDRYEMCAAVSAGIPYGIPFAHLHGGETTLGAIDNIYRHAITLASQLHFVSAEAYRERVASVLGHNQQIYLVGALSLDTLASFKPLSISAIKQKWNIDLSPPTILITIHPETANAEGNKKFVKEIEKTLLELKSRYQLLITMPNADTMGTLYRTMLNQLAANHPEHIKLVENFGTEGYFSCMHHARLMLGNTSSGIIEAASFKKYVIDIGDRQKGRLTSGNVLHAPIQRNAIMEKIAQAEERGLYTGDNIYWNGGAAAAILTVLKHRK